ncbi:MAG: transglycosylase SLT domain-containing protein [Acetobacteraceae bacterium]
MRSSIRILIALAALSGATVPASAQPPRDPTRNPIPAIRADQWAEAEAAAAGYADPVPQKLVSYYRMLAPGSATAPEIADFMQRNPDWPNQAQLARRWQEAIAAEPDQAVALSQCEAAPVTLPSAMLRCAEALAIDGRNDAATELARRAWITAISDAATEAVYQRRWNGITTPDEEWARFLRLAWRDPTAAARQLARLDPLRRPVGEIRLALKRDDAAVDASWRVLTSEQQDDPGMVLDRARFLRRTDRLAEAVALWNRAGAAAQKAAPNHLAEFWSERNILIRRLMREGSRADAYALAASHGQPGSEARLDAEFLAGFLALRSLNDPARALRHFQTLAESSKSAITQGRAHYWLGRARAAAGGDPKPDYIRSAAWATTFYGQMSSLALGEDAATLAGRVRAMRDPSWTSEVVFAFAGHDVVRAAAWLVAWGDPLRARPFLLRMDEIAPIPGERALAAALALRVGLPDMAVFIGRRMGRDGGALPESGWPMPYEPPTDFDPAIALGVMRQESSFDIRAVSTSGARGLMQLMPFTARDVAKKLGIATSLPMLTSDPSHNMRLGTSYLRDMLARFDGSLPLAVAAYNAGPSRVEQWVTENGDPRVAGGPIDMIDWLESIPYNETRNYVQRVLENIVIYRARRNEDTPTLMAQWTR